jgi:RNA polymerase sigma-70 factor, ECF subfamily
VKEVLATITEARARFLELVAEVRPELHRYCARMTGSVFDGEDVVQDTLAKAYFGLAEMESPPPLRPWLFRIAHNTAMDHLRRYEHRNVSMTDDLESIVDAHAAVPIAPDGARVEHALQIFAALPPVQRSALALKDVLGLSLEDTADTMGITVGAVKAALSRARAKINAEAPRAPELEARELDRLRRYANLFNAHDWDGLKALFGEETELDVVSRDRRKGRPAAEYFNRYAQKAPGEGLRATAGFVDGVPVIAMSRPNDAGPSYFVRITWRGDRITHVRDFRFVPYIAQDASFTVAGG